MAKETLTVASTDLLQFQVLEGPMTRFFHRFVKRRSPERNNPRPYPFLIGGIERTVRMLDVADTWEQVVLGVAPFLLIGAWVLHRLHLPLVVQGYSVLLIGCYAGFHFVVWVFLDRRLDQIDLLRVRSLAHLARDEREDRVKRRFDLKKTKVEREQQAAEAREHGQAKARQFTTEPSKAGGGEESERRGAPMTGSLDELLDKP